MNVLGVLLLQSSNLLVYIFPVLALHLYLKIRAKSETRSMSEPGSDLEHGSRSTRLNNE